MGADKFISAINQMEKNFLASKSSFWKFLFIPAFVGIVILVYGINYKIDESKFFKKKSHSVIIDSSTWQGRTYTYYTKDSLEIISSSHYRNNYPPGKIDVVVGDSIVKAPNTLEFSVYKKDVAGQYFFHSKYTYGKDVW